MQEKDLCLSGFLQSVWYLLKAVIEKDGSPESKIVA